MRKAIFFLILILCLASCSLAGAYTLRVGVVEQQSTVELSCEGDFTVIANGEVTTMPKGKYFIHNDGGRLRFDDDRIFGGSVEVRSVKGKPLPQLNKRSYKGNLRLTLTGDKLTAVNYVDLEDYLASVLPAKTMVVWPDEGIKAQAVAARSYAMYMAEQNRYKAFDISANDKELDYEGTGPRIEKTAVTKLIAATAGRYLVDYYGNAVMAVPTSSTGGRTESARELWGRDVPCLQSVEDYDSDSPDYTWEQMATPALLEARLAQRGYVVGKLTGVRLSPLDAPGADRTATGRVKTMVLTGEAGSVTLSGEEIAELVGLPGTLFDVETGTPAPEVLKVPIEDRYGYQVGSKDIGIKVKEEEKPVWNTFLRSYHMLSGGNAEKLIFRGKGRGSGLGLSAWGARGMCIAREHITYQEILAHYYPHTELR